MQHAFYSNHLKTIAKIFQILIYFCRLSVEIRSINTMPNAVKTFKIIP